VTASLSKIPTTVVTGFLGSGKTTLLRHLIQHAGGRRLALIVNEFGEVGVDGELLRQCAASRLGDGPDGSTSASEETCDAAAGQLYELANGCLCCTVQDELVPVLEALLARAARPDHIVIETSGLALPKPLVQAFQWPEIRTACTVDAIVTVVDGPAVLRGAFAADPAAVALARALEPELDHARPLRDLFEDQLSVADLVILHKADLLEPGALRDVRARIAAIARAEVKIIAAAHGALPIDLVLGMHGAVEATIDARATHHDAHHAEGRPHDHDHFDTCVLRLPALSRHALLRGVQAVVQQHEVYRVKGFADVPEKPMRLVIQGVGRRVEAYFDRAWRTGEPRETRLVWIGVELSPASLEKTFLEAIAE
jgi:cobalamin biosynthesis protein CobW